MVSQFCVKTHLLEVGLTQNLIDHEISSMACHVGIHVGLFSHSNFLVPLGTQARVESEVGQSWHFLAMRL